MPKSRVAIPDHDPRDVLGLLISRAGGKGAVRPVPLPGIGTKPGVLVDVLRDCYGVALAAGAVRAP